MNKPFTRTEVLAAVANALRRRREVAAGAQALRRLQESVHRHQSALLDGRQRQESQDAALNHARAEATRRLVRMLGYRDGGLEGHNERVAHLCELIATDFGLDPDISATAGALHDVGKVAVPDAILRKQGPLTPDERRIVETHTTVGYEILRGSGDLALDRAAVAALTHHERLDGSGYPRGLAGDSIPIEGRIVAVLDVFEALTSSRPYRPALPTAEALGHLRRRGGSLFDARVVERLGELLAHAPSPRTGPASVGAPA